MLKLRITSRLYLGFGLTIAALTLISVLSVLFARQTSTHFASYANAMDRREILLRIQEDVTEGRLAAFAWRVSGAASAADDVRDNFSEVHEDASLLAQSDPQTAQAIGDMATQYEAAFAQAMAYQDQRNDAYNRYRASEAAFFNTLENTSNASIAAFALVSAEKFLLENKGEDGDRAIDAFEQVAQTNEVAAQKLAAFRDLRQAIEARNEMFSTHMDRLGPEMLDLAETTNDNAYGFGNELKQQGLQALSSSKMITTVLGLATVLIAGIIAWRTSLSITRPLHHAMNATQALSNQELDHPVNGQDRKDEMGELARALEGFRQKLIKTQELEAEQAQTRKTADMRAKRINTLIDTFEQETAKAVDNVTEAADTLRSSARIMSEALTESEETVIHVASGSTQASANVETLASSAEEMSASIQEISRAADEVTERVDRTTALAGDAKSNLSEMQASVAEMTGVIEAINAVAEQTNLLALNATIEAARAGEAGKGFAVVATEVKALANQAQQLNEEIAAKIAHVKDRSSATTDAAEQMLNALEDIRARAMETAAAVNQQTQAVSEISNASQEAAEGTRRTSKNLDGIRHAAGEATQQAQTVAGIGTSLDERAQHLQESVNRFLKDVAAA